MCDVERGYTYLFQWYSECMNTARNKEIQELSLSDGSDDDDDNSEADENGNAATLV